MDSTTEKMILRSQGGRIPQGTANEPSTVPARSSSTSDEGLTEVLALDTPRNTDTGNDEPRHDQGHEKENGKDNEGKDEGEGTNEAIEDDSSMDTAVCRKRNRDTSSEKEEEEDEVIPSQKMRKSRIIRDEQHEEGVKINQEPSAYPISISDDNEDVQITSLYEERVYVGDEEDEDYRKEKKRGRGRPKKERRKVIGVQDLDVHELSDSEDSEGFNVTSAAEAGARALEYLDAVDQIRVKSKNIKGDLSGIMKKRLKDSKEIVRALMRKAEKSRNKKNKEKESEKESEKEIENNMLKMKNKELESRLKEKEREGKVREEEVEQLQKIVFDMKKEIDRLKEKIEILEQKQQKQVAVKEDSPKRKKVKSKRDTYLEDRATYLENMATTEESTAWEESDVPEKGKMDYQHSMEFRRSPKERSTHDLRPPETVEDPQHLKQKKILEIQANRDKLKSKGTIGNVEQERDHGESSEMTEWPALPQRKTREFRSSIRKDIKVLSNVKLAGKVKVIPPPSSSAPKEEGKQQEEWKVVKGRKEARNEKKIKGQVQEQQQQRRSDMKQGARRRPPRSAAITIRGANENFSYADALRKARDNPTIKEIGIENTRLRKTAMGNVLIEIVGEKEKREEKAEKLAHALQQLLTNEAKIARPVIKGELRMFGLDDSISKEEIKSLMMEIGKCNEGAITVGDIRPMRNGLGMIWAQCPLTLAIQMANLKTIIWSSIQIELLERRPVQCYKCWKTGHLKHACKSSVDRTNLCYRCGSQGHQVKGCNKDVNCVICKEEGYDAKHRVGSLVCINNNRRKNINKTDKTDHDSRKEKESTEENEKMEIITNDDD